MAPTSVHVKLFLCITFSVSSLLCCSTDNDCSLLGECNKGKCVCDPGWTGKKCGQVDLLPAQRYGGYRNASLSTWGGKAIKVGHKWHMFASGMSHNCSLSNFATNSMTVHTISNKPGGPYSLADIPLPEFHHSTTVLEVNNSTLAIFTVGINTHGKNVHSCEHFGSNFDLNQTKRRNELGPHDYVSVSISSSGPYGPWQEHVIFKTNLSEPYAWNCNYSNPSPIIFPNGTVLVMYRGVPCIKDPSCKNETMDLCEHQGIAMADSINGPFHDRQGKISELSGNEDAVFFRTRRGYAALFHSKNACGQGQAHMSCGSLAYSKDTWSWTLNSEPTYNATIQWRETNGDVTVDRLLSRQRPKIIFSEDGMTPLFLTNGVLSSEKEWDGMEWKLGKEFTVAAPFNVPDNACRY